MDEDFYFMREALKEAKKAFAAEEVPVGAVLVLENIPRGSEESGIGQGGSPDFLAGARGIAKGKTRSEDEKSGGKADAGQNRLFNHERYKIIARGHNQVELLQDATAHAEMLCMTAGASALSNWRLAETTLYCTLEPCPMCAGAMFASRIKRLVWAAPDLRLGANGSWIDLFREKHPMHSIEVVSGVLEEEAASLMKEFFQGRRKWKTSSMS